MALTIKTSNFEGPFDLLLHLIKKNQMDIYNISILEITNKYIGYLSEMKELDLDIASEFIVTAATLIELKSKVLLPKKKEPEIEEVDDAQELIDKLLQYKKFKNAAEFLGTRQMNTGVTFTKRPEIIEDTREKKQDAKDLLRNVTMMDLYNMYNSLIEIYLNKMNDGFNMEERIQIEVFKIEDKMEHLKEVLNDGKNTTFASIIKNNKSKIEVIVTFLALLELIKLKDVKVVQNGNFSEIYLEGVGEYE
ncbi:MAG: segregation/condensation protein A [Clostridium sp.]|uniref:segregation/condensation protein A n=1 Tax=Clostridium sp. TaxID=1506 RepID=UPI0030417CF8